MAKHRLDIPLDRDGSARFLPWLVALMVYLAGIALGGTLVIDGAMQRWDRSLSGTLTLELPAAPLGRDKGDGGMAAALAILRATPGIERVQPLDAAATAKLVEPWLGTSLTPEELALPRLVDLRIAPRGVDLPGLKAKLAAAAPGAVLDDHRLWLDRLVDLAVSIEATALVVLLLIGAAAVLTIAFTTRTGLAVHHDVIELLHLMGARDFYIARQFGREALRMGLKGGVIGMGFAGLTILALGHMAHRSAGAGQGIALLPGVTLDLWHWLALLLLPLVTAVTAMATAQVTVLRALARMP